MENNKYRILKQWARVGQILFVALLIGLVYSIQPYRIYYNYTESALQGLYLADTSATIFKKGDFVVFVYPEPIWARGRYVSDIAKIDYYFKQIKGVAGDTIKLDSNKNVIICNSRNQCKKSEKLAYIDSNGRKMYPIEWNNDEIPSGFVYVGTDYEKSLSSSYYGLIQTKKMIAKAIPLITWQGKFIKEPVKQKSMIPE